MMTTRSWYPVSSSTTSYRRSDVGVLWVEDLEGITSAIYKYFVASLFPDSRKILCIITNRSYNDVQKWRHLLLFNFSYLIQTTYT